MRLRALVRRAAGHAAPLILCGPVAYDAQLGAFSLDGLPLRLTALEWRVLSCLMLRKEHVVARRDILERVYDGDAEVDSNSVEVIIARLRRKIGPSCQSSRRTRTWEDLLPGPRVPIRSPNHKRPPHDERSDCNLVELFRFENGL